MHICSIVFLCLVIIRHVIVVNIKPKERVNTTMLDTSLGGKRHCLSFLFYLSLSCVPNVDSESLSFLFCLSLSCVPNVASFTELFIPDCPFCFANVYSWRISYSVATPGSDKINGVSLLVYAFSFPRSTLNIWSNI